MQFGNKNFSVCGLSHAWLYEAIRVGDDSESCGGKKQQVLGKGKEKKLRMWAMLKAVVPSRLKISCPPTARQEANVLKKKSSPAEGAIISTN